MQPLALTPRWATPSTACNGASDGLESRVTAMLGLLARLRAPACVVNGRAAKRGALMTWCVLVGWDGRETETERRTTVDVGFLTVSSTEMMRHAASEAAVMALIFTIAGSHTAAAKLSEMSSLYTSTPNHCPPVRANTHPHVREWRLERGGCVGGGGGGGSGTCCVLLAQLVEHVGRVEPGVVAQLPGDDLQRLRACVRGGEHVQPRAMHRSGDEDTPGGELGCTYDNQIEETMES